MLNSNYNAEKATFKFPPMKVSKKHEEIITKLQKNLELSCISRDSSKHANKFPLDYSCINEQFAYAHGVIFAYQIEAKGGF